MAKAIALDYYNRCIRVPIGDSLPNDTDLNDEVEIVIKGRVKMLEAAVPKDAEYKGQAKRPAEMKIEITSVSFEGKTNTFTKLDREFDGPSTVGDY